MVPRALLCPHDSQGHSIDLFVASLGALLPTGLHARGGPGVARFHPGVPRTRCSTDAESVDETNGRKHDTRHRRQAGGQDEGRSLTVEADRQN